MEQQRIKLADGWSNTAAEPTLNRYTREMDEIAQTPKVGSNKTEEFKTDLLM
jgi:hypothetical protein